MTKGLLLARVRATPRHDHPFVRCFTSEPDSARSDLRWYVDGSVVEQDYPELVTAAAAIVVASTGGDLLAYAEIVLPPLARSWGAGAGFTVVYAAAHGGAEMISVGSAGWS